MAACTQCREMTGASATVVPHNQLVRGVTIGIAAGREAEALDGLEWYRCTTCRSHLVRDRDKFGVFTQWTLAREVDA